MLKARMIMTGTCTFLFCFFLNGPILLQKFLVQAGTPKENRQQGFKTGQTSFLSPNQQCQSSEAGRREIHCQLQTAKEECHLIAKMYNVNLVTTVPCVTTIFTRTKTWVVRRFSAAIIVGPAVNQIKANTPRERERERERVTHRLENTAGMYNFCDNVASWPGLVIVFVSCECCALTDVTGT